MRTSSSEFHTGHGPSRQPFKILNSKKTGAAVAIAAAVLSLTPAAAAGASVASATPAHAAARPGPLGPKDSAEDRGVRIWREYTGSGYQIWAEATRDNAFFGHFHLWGPGADVNIPTSPPFEVWWPVETPTQRANGSGSGWACAEGWRLTDHYESIGRPCIQI